jgi:3-oxoacyl-[acyl-carrier protein] reductase
MPNNQNLKTALVTGSSKGIGAGIAKYLLKKGFFVYVTYCSSKDKAEKQFSDKENTQILHLDLREKSSVKKVIEKIQQYHSKLNLLVNNANVEIPGTTEEIDLEVWEEIFRIRVFGTFLMTKYSLPLLKKAELPLIVNISSALPRKGHPKFPAHTASEAAIDSYTKTCAVDFAKYGIRCHTVNPTATKTEMWKDIGGYDDDEMWKKFAQNNPLGRVSTPQDIGKAIYLLTRREAAYLNGNEIFVNGGVHLK